MEVKAMKTVDRLVAVLILLLGTIHASWHPCFAAALTLRACGF
jgi:hypothetical protein